MAFGSKRWGEVAEWDPGFTRQIKN